MSSVKTFLIVVVGTSICGHVTYVVVVVQCRRQRQGLQLEVATQACQSTMFVAPAINKCICVVESSPVVAVAGAEVIGQKRDIACGQIDAVYSGCSVLNEKCL